MNPLDDFLLDNFLRTDANNILYQKEDNKIEYKQIFDRNSKEAKAKYLKELAAFYNFDGGYLIFGVNDKTLELVGLENFTEPDNSVLSDDLKSYFAPSFAFTSKTHIIGGKHIFIIHVEKRKSIPTVCIKEFPDVLCESIIYWRYSGQSSPIKSGDLISLLNSLRGEETSRLADIHEKELKAKYKPYLRTHGSASRAGEITLGFINEGERAVLTEINVLEGKVRVTPFQKLPYTLTKNQEFKLPVDSMGAHGSYLNYKLEFIFNDEIGTLYKAIGVFNGASGKISDPIEIANS